MQVSDFKTAFNLIHLLIKEENTYHYYLDFNFYGKSNNVTAAKTLYIQLLNEDHEYIP